MKKVLIKGPLLTSSGYGVHARQVFNALKTRKDIDLYTQVTNWGNCSWILDTSSKTIKDILECSHKTKTFKKFDESFQVLIPNEWSKIATKDFGVTAGFECDIVKKSWIEDCNSMDAVIVPSLFAKNAFLKTCKKNKINLKTKISVINEWYYRDFDKEESNSNLDIDQHFKFKKNILIFCQVSNIDSKSDRKNLIKTITSACDAIEDFNCGILLKTNLGKSSNLYKKKIIEIIKERIDIKFHKKISFLFGNFSISELKSLYENEKISCFLSGTRGEGWGLPFIEAAACGLPIIAPNHSAYKEFLEEDFIKVNYSLVTFNNDPRFTDREEEPKWAEFEYKDMVDKIHLFFKNEKKFNNISVNRKKIIKQNFNFNNIIVNYTKFFESNCK